MLRCRGVPAHTVDLALARAAAILWRDGSDLLLGSRDDVALRAHLAFAGVAAELTEAQQPAPSGVPLIGRSLDPLAAVPCVDVVRMRVLALGDASRWLLRRRWPWERRDEARRRCAAVMHGDDAVIEWERRLWVSRSALADARVRQVARPILIDRDAAIRPRPAGRVLASAGAITAWGFR